MPDNDPGKIVDRHRELPPLEAELVAEHTLEATSGRVTGTIGHRDELWDRCYQEPMANTEVRLAQEIARFGGHYAHVHDEFIDIRRDDAAGDAWLHGRFGKMLYPSARGLTLQTPRARLASAGRESCSSLPQRTEERDDSDRSRGGRSWIRRGMRYPTGRFPGRRQTGGTGCRRSGSVGGRETGPSSKSIPMAQAAAKPLGHGFDHRPSGGRAGQRMDHPRAMPLVVKASTAAPKPHCMPKAPTKTSKLSAVLTRPDIATGKFAVKLRIGDVAEAEGDSEQRPQPGRRRQIDDDRQFGGQCQPHSRRQQGIGETPRRARASVQVARRLEPG